jgi:hypothetical protein
VCVCVCVCCVCVCVFVYLVGHLDFSYQGAANKVEDASAPSCVCVATFAEIYYLHMKLLFTHTQGRRRKRSIHPVCYISRCILLLI